jgi:hypothetical protein
VKKAPVGSAPNLVDPPANKALAAESPVGKFWIARYQLDGLITQMIRELDRIIERSLRQLAEDTHAWSWRAKERDWVNYFAHRYLIGQCTRGGLICMMKVVSATIILFVASLVMAQQGQQTVTDALSYTDESDIVEAVLNPDLNDRPSRLNLPHIRTVSSANIEFIDTSRLREHGFTLVTSSQLSESKKDHVVDYLVFKKIELAQGVARVVVWHVTEGRPCFSSSFSSHTMYTYECRRTLTGWRAVLVRVSSSERQLISLPMPLMTLDPKIKR